ncbi:MAG: hypothetical protein US96_C0014G0020 [Candidatus Woesebacteria bacterium GW2011_GWB1_38_5b]|uniref:DUF4870 domain-containing protein n=1 Tax=Candidatus Woesebacteria bacterium GW2011_GWB1_38_5b TaxID=1618569 RepID=A0A0G0K8V5_9BACT|nr:MAG: hypothetical protein US96_C0014G0020 [Candidatus Woesebacteria bacterium GW2011_GWB1_38_5b]
MANQTGLKKETAAALSYVLGPLSGLAFLLLEKDPFVRFHAMQSIVVLGIIFALGMILAFIPFVGGIMWLLYFVVLLMGAYQASQGKKWEAPILGKIARSLLKS